jgi:hypothetical protein
MLTTMKVKLKKQGFARAGGVLDMTETDWMKMMKIIELKIMVRRTALRNLIWMSMPIRQLISLKWKC